MANLGTKLPLALPVSWWLITSLVLTVSFPLECNALSPRNKVSAARAYQRVGTRSGWVLEMNRRQTWHKKRAYPYHRQVAMTFRKSLPPMLITYFEQPGELSSASTESTPDSPRGSLVPSSPASPLLPTEPETRHRKFYLGLGFLGTITRDSGTSPGAQGLSYGGFALTMAWTLAPSWMLRASMGYTSRTFSPLVDPTGGITNGSALVGQNWMTQISLEYEWLHWKYVHASSGWANLFEYSYRSRDFFTAPTIGRAWYYKTGVGSTIRIDLFERVQMYADGQFLFGLGSRLETQGVAGAGIQFSLD